MTAHCEWCPFPGCDSCAYKGWRRSEPAVIQTPDTRGPWDQRKSVVAGACVTCRRPGRGPDGRGSGG